jgi:hypothetical protein
MSIKYILSNWVIEFQFLIRNTGYFQYLQNTFVFYNVWDKNNIKIKTAYIHITQIITEFEQGILLV